MSAPAAVAAPAAAKSPAKKKSGKPKKAATHPTYHDMIGKAIKDLKERGGSSRQAILKYIVANYKVGDAIKANWHLKQALRSGVKKGALKQSKGTGAAGSFRLGDNAGSKKVKKTKKPKAAGAKKVKKPKTAGTKKPKVKKPKAAVTKKPKPAAAKKTTKAKPAKKAPAKKATKPKKPKVSKKKPAAKK